MVIHEKDDRRKNRFLKRYKNPPTFLGDATTKNIYTGFSEKVVGFTLYDIEAIAENIHNSHIEIWEAFKNLEKKGIIKHGERPTDTNIFLIFKQDKSPEDPLERKIYQILLDL